MRRSFLIIASVIAIAGFFVAFSASSTRVQAQRILLDVPFSSQAPHRVWDALHKEACEEASALMALRYVRREPILSADDADASIRMLVARSEELGFPIDAGVEDVARLLRSVEPTIETTVIENPTRDDIIRHLASGRILIVPALGRKLKNPYFTAPGPRYHMLVIRGVSANQRSLVTNDPGTRRGERFLYSFETILEANRDWSSGDPENGRRLMLAVGRAE